MTASLPSLTHLLDAGNSEVSSPKGKGANQSSRQEWLHGVSEKNAELCFQLSPAPVVHRAAKVKDSM